VPLASALLKEIYLQILWSFRVPTEMASIWCSTAVGFTNTDWSERCLKITCNILLFNSRTRIFNTADTKLWAMEASLVG
jgi:hypothetical protein